MQHLMRNACAALLIAHVALSPLLCQAQTASSNGASSSGSGPKKRLGDAVGWFKGLGQAATSMVSAGGGRAADAAEDPEYIKVSRS